MQFNNQQIFIGTKIKFEEDQVIVRKYAASSSSYVSKEFLVDAQKLVKDFNESNKTQEDYDKLWSKEKRDEAPTSHIGLNAKVTKMSNDKVTLSFDVIVGGVRTNWRDEHLEVKPKITEARVSKKKVVILKSLNKELFR